MSEINRREFVVGATTIGAAAAVAACWCCGSDEALAQMSTTGPATRPIGGKIDVGALSDFPKNVISDKFAPKNSARLFVIRQDDRIFACTSTCTHKGCTVKLMGDHIECPCHHATYSEHGTPTSGPAKAALMRYAISLNDAMHLIVDKSRTFGERQWEDPASYVTVPAPATKA